MMQNTIKKVKQACIVVVSLLLPLWYCYTKGLGYFSEYFSFGVSTNYVDETELLVTGCAFFLFLIYLAWRGHLPQIKNGKWVWLGLLPIGVGIVTFITGCYGVYGLERMADNISKFVLIFQIMEICLLLPIAGILFSACFMKTRPYAAILLGCTSMGLAGGSFDILQSLAGVDLAVGIESLRYYTQVIWRHSLSVLLIYVGFGLVFCLAHFILKKIKPTKKNLVMQEPAFERGNK